MKDREEERGAAASPAQAFQSTHDPRQARCNFTKNGKEKPQASPGGTTEPRGKLSILDAIGF